MLEGSGNDPYMVPRLLLPVPVTGSVWEGAREGTREEGASVIRCLGRGVPAGHLGSDSRNEW